MSLVNRSELKRALPLLKSMSESRKTMPILATVRLESSETEVRLASTDLESAVVVEFKAYGETFDSVCIDAKSLAKAVSSGRTEMVSFTTPESGASLQVDSVTLQGVNADEYPTLCSLFAEDDCELESFDVETVSRLLAESAYAASRNESRHNLNGVYVEPQENGRIRWIATDGHRLAVSEPEIACAWPRSEGQPATPIMPIRFVGLLAKSIRKSKPWGSTVTFRQSGNQLEARIGPVTMLCRFIDGEFPHYRQVCPRPGGNPIDVDRSELLEALARLAPVLSERSKAVRMTVSGDAALLLEASDDTGNEGSETVAARVTGLADGFRIGFNAGYLESALKSFTCDTLTFRVSDQFSPVELRGDGSSFAVVMPTRL